MPGPHDATISVNETDLHWGDQVTFSYTADDPKLGHRLGIMVDAFQGDAYVYGARDLVPGEFMLKSNYWTGGAAHCVATLYDLDFGTNKQRDLATTEFDVAA